MCPCMSFVSSSWFYCAVSFPFCVEYQSPPGHTEGPQGAEEEMCPGDEERYEAEEKVAGQGESAQRLRLGGGFTYAQD